MWKLYLVVQVQVIKLSIGSELLSVVVQSKVDIPAVTLDDNRVPVVIIQQAPTGHSRVTLNRTVLVAACRHVTSFMKSEVNQVQFNRTRSDTNTRKIRRTPKLMLSSSLAL